MKITKYEQSGFIFESDKGYKLAVDIGVYTPEDKLKDMDADFMIVSHIHGDHFSIPHIKAVDPEKLFINSECMESLGEEVIEADIQVIKSGDVVKFGDFGVTVFDVDHGPNVKVVPRENFGFLFEIDDKKVYFGGDIFYPSGIDVSLLEVDYALIPVGGFYTFGPEEALAFVRSFKKIGEIIPMHYEKTPETKDTFAGLVKDSFKIV